LTNKGPSVINIRFVVSALNLAKIPQFETFEKCSILFKVKPPAPLPARRAYRPEGRAYALSEL
jgi:hypothetical protein